MKKSRKQDILETEGHTDAGHPAHSRFVLDSLPSADRRRVLEVFVRELDNYLRAETDAGDPVNRKGELMQRVAEKAMLKTSLDSRHFDTLLRNLFRERYLRLGYHLASERADHLKREKKLRDIDITVVAGSDPERFSQAAAETFIQELFRIGNEKHRRFKDSAAVINVGIVSGNTTGAVIRAAEQLQWLSDLGLDASSPSFPQVRVFALNVCLTVPEHLSGNANLLVHSFAVKLNKEAKSSKAKAFGLSAPLMVEKSQLRDADRAPQTIEVVRYTEPYRVLEKLKEMNQSVEGLGKNHTELDIVLTGVGELPTDGGGDHQPTHTSEPRGSIFYNLGKQFGIDMDDIINRERIVGDLAFTAIRSDGLPVSLYKERSKSELSSSGNHHKSAAPDDGGRVEYVFYSAVQLAILAEMAKDRSKSVILVARYDEGKYKVPAIFASIAGERQRYASRLVIDEATAEKLVHY